MLRVAKHLTQLLDASTKLERRLTFVVVVPRWPKRPAWEALHAVPHRARAEVSLANTATSRARSTTSAVSNPPVTRPSSSCRPRKRRDEPRHRRRAVDATDARSRAAAAARCSRERRRSRKVSKSGTRRFESSRTFLSCRHCIARTACGARFANPSPCLSCERLVSPPRRLSIPACAPRSATTASAILSSPLPPSLYATVTVLFRSPRPAAREDAVARGAFDEERADETDHGDPSVPRFGERSEADASERSVSPRKSLAVDGARVAEVLAASTRRAARGGTWRCLRPGKGFPWGRP